MLIIKHVYDCIYLATPAGDDIYSRRRHLFSLTCRQQHGPIPRCCGAYDFDNTDFATRLLFEMRRKASNICKCIPNELEHLQASVNNISIGRYHLVKCCLVPSWCTLGEEDCCPGRLTDALWV